MKLVECKVSDQPFSLSGEKPASDRGHSSPA
jgi:hypothetical protein